MISSACLLNICMRLCMKLFYRKKCKTKKNCKVLRYFSSDFDEIFSVVLVIFYSTFSNHLNFSLESLKIKTLLTVVTFLKLLNCVFHCWIPALT